MSSGRGASEPYGDSPLSPEEKQAAEERNAAKLNQIVQVRGRHVLERVFGRYGTNMGCYQQFFVKGALTVISSRVILSQSFNRIGELRQNKWVR